jgi:hypothetical protein
MQCAKCGFENPAEAKFCGRCGESMKPTSPIPSGGGEAVPQGLMIGIAVGSFFFFPLGLVMGAIYMNDSNPEKKKAGKLWMFISIGVIALFCICGGLSALFNPNAFN